FGIDRIDNFVISNCELPQTLPLSFILDRTQTSSQNGGFHLTSTVGAHSFSINTTGQQHFFDTLPSIKTLVIKSRKRVSVTQLNTLLSDLRTLEELQLTDFDLYDIDSYAIETYDTHSPRSSSVLNGLNVHHPRRIKRKSNDEHLISHNDDDDDEDSIIVTTMNTNAMSSSHSIPTTTTATTVILPLNIETTI
ncbi:hypothetical protein BLA29_010105, partial [Euroglyphus maynei]